MEERWVVAQVQLRREDVARVHIERQGGKVYSPLCHDNGKISRLFPGYVFVHTAWPSLVWLHSTTAVTRVIKMGETICTVKPEIIEAYRSMEDENGIVLLPEKPIHTFKMGQNLKITSGVMTGYVGTYAGMSAQQRVFVLLNMFGRKTQVDMAVDEVTEAE